MKKETRKVHREFLNEDDGIAFCQTKVSHDHYKSGYNIDGSVDIGDCNRIISLEFYCHDEETAELALKKCDKLIAMLTTFRAELSIACEAAELRKNEQEENQD